MIDYFIKYQLPKNCSDLNNSGKNLQSQPIFWYCKYALNGAIEKAVTLADSALQTHSTIISNHNPVLGVKVNDSLAALRMVTSFQ